jgi:hypothetical protein
MDSHTKDAVANTMSISGIFALLMEFQAEITILLLITGLALNAIRLWDRFTRKSKD